MKKILAVLTAVCLLFSLCGCHFGAYYIKQEGMTINYNNIFNGGELWLTENAVCFLRGGLFLGSIRYVCLTPQGEKSIDWVDFDCGVFIDNDTAYITETSAPSNGNVFGEDEVTDPVPYLCVYNINNGQKRYIKVDIALDWWEYRISVFYVLNDTLLFVVSYNGDNGENTDALYAMSLEKEEIIKIHENIVLSSLGVLDGIPVYAVEQDGQYCLYNYDLAENKSVLIGKLTHKKIRQASSVAIRYIPGGVLVNTADAEDGRETVLIYDIKQQTFTAEHEVDVGVYQPIPFENYVFFYDSEKKAGNEEEWYDVVYRLKLSDGTYEKVATFENQYIDLFVTSDNFVYVKTDEYIYRCDMDGNKEIVCKF